MRKTNEGTTQLTTKELDESKIKRDEATNWIELNCDATGRNGVGVPDWENEEKGEQKEKTILGTQGR